jgi:uncharacterized membrane protein (UPF0127 family)
MYIWSMFTSAKIIAVICLVGLTACQAKDSVIIQTPSGGQAVFAVDIAKTEDEQHQGLMFVESMADSYGMVFVYDRPQVLKFWMKNTLIPLDMLFFDEKGILVHIEKNAIPHDLTPRGPNIPACLVLEINGGLSEKLEIRTGSKLINNFTDECLQSLPE